MASSIDGIWDCIITAPSGKDPHEMEVHTAPDGTVTGTVKSLQLGTVMEMKDGRFDGKVLSWTMQLVKPFKLTVKSEVEVDGDSLAGHGGTAMLGKVPITGKKRAA